MPKFASRVLIDHADHSVWVDGEKFPYWLEEDGPDVSIVNPELGITCVNLPILVDGIVTVVSGVDSREIYDPVLGNVADAARKIVREGFAEAFPWMNLETV